LPALGVVSANLQPEHKAVLEGAQQILFDGPSRMAVKVNAVQMYLPPRCFWQTNDTVAAALYRQVRDWCAEIDPPSLWDLYCGVGGFALHCADGRRNITGVEIGGDAIDCAIDAARVQGDRRLRFLAGDACEFAES